MKREEMTKKPLLARVRRIEGQVAGIGRMIEEDRYCPDILNTIASVHAALTGLEASLLEDHVRHCIVAAVEDGVDLEPKIEELGNLYRRKSGR
jgi:DNA-binding FrmR family transcriptional regulator